MAAVVIPVYKKNPSADELLSLKQCIKILGKKHPIILVRPYSLDDKKYHLPGTNIKVECFEDIFFANVKGYNELMLSETFYNRFTGYKYILIYQLDAFVFKDELNEWCSKGYDYIGAPWLDFINPGTSFAEKLQFARRAQEEYLNNKLDDSGIPTDAQFYRKVGNGGFSLRNVKKFKKICRTKKNVIDIYNRKNTEHHFFNEDVFWSLEVNRKKPQLKIPSLRVALHFAFEQKPEWAFKCVTKQQLPFGCHAWNLYPEFWNQFIHHEHHVI